MKKITWVLLLVTPLLFVQTTASASPWTLPRGTLAVLAGFDYQWAEQQFLDEGGAKDFSLNGFYSQTTYALNTRFGFTDDLEIGLYIPIKIIGYKSDPIILGPSDGVADLDTFQSNTFDFSRDKQGVGDIDLNVTYAFIKKAIAMAGQIKLTTPTGYDKPTGTFGGEAKTTEEFIQQNMDGSLTQTQNLEDDVTLGDGVLNLSFDLLFGASFPTRTFIRADAGYKLRTAGAADQFTGAFKVGQLIGSHVLVFADTRFAQSIEQGKLIGVSPIAKDPNVPADQYDDYIDPEGNPGNVILREVRLYRDTVEVGGGVILKLAENVEFNISYSRIVYGRNTSVSNGIFLSVGTRFNTQWDEVEEEVEVSGEEYEAEEWEEELGDTQEIQALKKPKDTETANEAPKEKTP